MSNLNLTNRLISIDLPSHGNSDFYSELSLDLYVNTIEELRNKLNLNNLILCGHSLGGAISLAYYFAYKNETDGLILMSTGAKLKVLPIILKNTKDNFSTYLENIPTGAFYRKTDDEIKGKYVKEIAKMKPEVVHTDFQICNNFDILNKINEITIPSLIIVGKFDKLTPIKYSEYFQKNIENSKLEIIENAGHSVMIEKPAQVNKVIENYIKSYF